MGNCKRTENVYKMKSYCFGGKRSRNLARHFHKKGASYLRLILIDMSFTTQFVNIQLQKYIPYTVIQ